MPAFTKALLLAVLLNLSGHMFLHLSDAQIEQDGVHLSSHSESKSVTAPTHQCSVCQDHQTLTIENSSPDAIHFVSESGFKNRWQSVQISSFIGALIPNRGPPQN